MYSSVITYPIKMTQTPVCIPSKPHIVYASVWLRAHPAHTWPSRHGAAAAVNGTPTAGGVGPASQVFAVCWASGARRRACSPCVCRHRANNLFVVCCYFTVCIPCGSRQRESSPCAQQKAHGDDCSRRRFFSFPIVLQCFLELAI